MNKQERRLVNLRWYCDLAVEAARLQHRRLQDGETSRPDVDFYVLSVWRLLELARQASDNDVVGARQIHNDMLARWPLLPEVRNWWIHARAMEWTTWFSDGIYRLQPDGGAVPVIDVLEDHGDVEHFYDQLCHALGPLPDLDD